MSLPVSRPTIPDIPKLERYMGFLLQEWAKMESTPLLSPDADPVNRTEVLGHTIQTVGDVPGLRLEFGVWKGNSIRKCAQAFPDRHWYGFDSFEGFPDDGRVDWQKPFKVIELPDTPKNVTLVKGYFSDTLDPFLAETPGEVAFVNVDCDIYSSTVDIFNALRKHNRLRVGLTIYFDELINYADYMWNESLALFELMEDTGYGVEWIAHDHMLRMPDKSVLHFYDDDHPRWLPDCQAGYWQQASCRLTAEGIDYGPISDPEYRDKLRWMAEGYRIRESAREQALAERNQRLADREVERARVMEERREARKKLEKIRQRENLEQRKEERRRAAEAAQKRP